MSGIQGGCLCGAVRYESADAAVTSVVCHCSKCQKQSGSALSINLVVPAAGFRITASAMATYHDVGDSGLAVRRHFCNRCGSPVYSELDANPGVVAVKAGTLDDPSWVHPNLHMWRDSAQAWVEIADDAICFPRNAVA
ncbi:glutathione-dependent formaldehyde-activating enzyme [compost metagenome]